MQRERRHTEPIEDIDLVRFYEFKAMCEHCTGIIRVPRCPDTLELEPGACRCCRCGQLYRVGGVLHLPARDLEVVLLYGCLGAV